MMKRRMFSVFMVVVLLLAVSASVAYAETKTNNELFIQLFNSVLNADSSSKAEVSVLNIGETASTDMAEFTLNACRFTDRVGMDSNNWFECVHDGNLTCEDERIFVWLSFTGRNLSKSEMSGYELCDIAVEYGDGYTYDDSIFSDGYNNSTASWLTPRAGLLYVEPLETNNYLGIIKCMEIVRADRKSPIYIVVTLPSSHGDVKVKYEFAAEEGADVSETAYMIAKYFDQALGELAFAKEYGGINTSRIKLLEERLPLTSKALPTIKENLNTLRNWTGKKNSNANKIKKLSEKTIDMIDELINSELRAFY